MVRLKNIRADRAIAVLPARKFVPSVVTMLSLCIGVTSLRMAFLGKLEIAIGLMVITSILDFMDGAIARALKSSTVFGAELDSLVDMVNFGICSPLLMYIWGTHTQRFGWLAVLFFVVSMGLRLARFNSMPPITDNEGAQIIRKSFFQGVPAPAGAMLNLVPMCASIAFEEIDFDILVKFSVVWSFIIGVALVSSVPTFSLKTIRIDKKNMFWVALGTNATIAIFVFDTVSAVLFCSALYIAAIPLSISSHKKMLAKYNLSPANNGKRKAED